MSVARMDPADVIVVGNFSDDPFAIDVAFAMAQQVDIAALINIGRASWRESV